MYIFNPIARGARGHALIQRLTSVAKSESLHNIGTDRVIDRKRIQVLQTILVIHFDTYFVHARALQRNEHFTTRRKNLFFFPSSIRETIVPL